MNKIIHATLLGLAMMIVMSANAESLNTVIENTLNTHPELQASVSDVLAQQEQLKQSRSGYYPTVDLMAGIGREATESPATRFNEETLTRQQLKLELRQNLFQGFATQSQVAQQQAYLDAAGAVLANDRNEIAVRVSEAYINVIRDREILLLAKQFVSDHMKIYQKIDRRSRSGVGLKSEKEHAAGRLALAQSNLIAAQSNLDDSIINYHAIVGKMPSGDMQLPAEISVSDSLETALISARKNNPSIAEASSQLVAASESRNVSQGKYYPKVDIVLSGSRNEDLDGLEGEDNDQLIMLELSYNLFNGGADRAREQQAAYEFERSKNLRDNTYRLVEQNVRYAWNELKSRTLQLVSMKQHLDASVKSRNVYADQYRIGKRSLLDLLDTENELFNARLNYANALHSIVISRYKLLASMGELATDK